MAKLYQLCLSETRSDEHRSWILPGKHIRNRHKSKQRPSQHAGQAASLSSCLFHLGSHFHLWDEQSLRTMKGWIDQLDLDNMHNLVNRAFMREKKGCWKQKHVTVAGPICHYVGVPLLTRMTLRKFPNCWYKYTPVQAPSWDSPADTRGQAAHS